jgi:7-cyano-7-deazaguanine synthase
MKKEGLGYYFFPRGSRTTLYKKLRETASLGVVCFCLSSFKSVAYNLPTGSCCILLNPGAECYRVQRESFFFFSGRDISLQIERRMAMNQEKALVVFSGGQDSTTCLLWAKKEFKEVETVTFNYGQRHVAELDCAKEIAGDLKVHHHVLDMSLLNQLAPSALTRNDEAITHEEGEMPSTFVPGRNLLFLSFAGVLAKQIGAKHIITGVCETDFSGYPDCRDIFVKSLNVSLNLSMDEQFVIHTPLMWINKAQTWEMADRLGSLKYIRENTLTCYNGVIGDGCGDCPACELRQQGLNEYLQSKKGGDE